MIELKPCTKTEHEDCPHLAIRKCCDVSRMHFCMKWRMNRAKDGIIHACEEPKEEPPKEELMICPKYKNCSHPNRRCVHRVPHKLNESCDYEGVMCASCVPYVHTKSESIYEPFPGSDAWMERYIERLTTEKKELSQKIARLEDLLSRSIKNNGLDKQARINVLAEEVRKKDRQIAAQKMTIDAQAAAIKEWVEDEKKRIKPTCETCRHDTIPAMDEPCRTCWGVQPPFKRWEPKEKEPVVSPITPSKKNVEPGTCDDCKYLSNTQMKEPCYECCTLSPLRINGYPKWEPIVKECPTCKYFPDHVSSSTCYKCLSINTPFALWEPK